MIRLNVSVMLGVVRLLNSGAFSTPKQLGISTADWKLLRSDMEWNALDRKRVVNTLESVMYGALDMMGLPRHDVSAEYRAAVIGYTVRPCNILSACTFFCGGIPNAMLANPDLQAEPEDVTPARLFALVQELYQEGVDELDDAANMFSERLRKSSEKRLEAWVRVHGREDEASTAS